MNSFPQKHFLVRLFVDVSTSSWTAKLRKNVKVPKESRNLWMNRGRINVEHLIKRIKSYTAGLPCTVAKLLLHTVHTQGSYLRDTCKMDPIAKGLRAGNHTGVGLARASVSRNAYQIFTWTVGHSCGAKISWDWGPKVPGLVPHCTMDNVRKTQNAQTACFGWWFCLGYITPRMYKSLLFFGASCNARPGL